MMRYIVAAVLLFSVACHAQCATYTLNVAAGGTYGATQTFDIDFHRTFSSIQSVRIIWSGTVTPSWCTYDWGDGPWGGRFEARLYRDGQGYGYAAFTPDLGTSTYPNPQAFVRTDWFQPYWGYQPWDFLLDGRARLDIRFDWLIGDPPPPWWVPTDPKPFGQLDSITLRLETAVPEPASLACFLTGVLVFGTIRLRRGRRR